MIDKILIFIIIIILLTIYTKYTQTNEFKGLFFDIFISCISFFILTIISYPYRVYVKFYPFNILYIIFGTITFLLLLQLILMTYLDKPQPNLDVTFNGLISTIAVLTVIFVLQFIFLKFKPEYVGSLNVLYILFVIFLSLIISLIYIKDLDIKLLINSSMNGNINILNQIMKTDSPFEPNIKEDLGIKLLENASKNGHIEYVKTLINIMINDGSTHSKDELIHQSLEYAKTSNQNNLILTFIKENKLSPLEYINVNPDLTMILINEYNLNFNDIFIDSVLNFNVVLVKKLLEKPIDTVVIENLLKNPVLTFSDKVPETEETLKVKNMRKLLEDYLKNPVTFAPINTTLLTPRI